jgi:hypothetical protein
LNKKIKLIGEEEYEPMMRDTPLIKIPSCFMLILLAFPTDISIPRYGDMRPAESNSAITAPLWALWVAKAATTSEGDSSVIKETKRAQTRECNMMEVFV